MRGDMELLPTPTPYHFDNRETPEQWIKRRADVIARTGTHHGLPLPVALESIAIGNPIRLSDPMAWSPEWKSESASSAETTPERTASVSTVSPHDRKQSPTSSLSNLEVPPVTGSISPTPSQIPSVNWGPYEAAIRRWEGTLNQPAPAPTEPGKEGRPRLSPRFVEWMMGLPDGWVCDVEGISRTQQLKILGNGVVPQQAIAAIEHLLDVVSEYATVQRSGDET